MWRRGFSPAVFWVPGLDLVKSVCVCVCVVKSVTYVDLHFIKFPCGTFNKKNQIEILE